MIRPLTIVFAVLVSGVVVAQDEIELEPGLAVLKVGEGLWYATPSSLRRGNFCDFLAYFFCFGA